MWLIDQIFSLVWDISGWFYEAFQEVKDWTWPLHYLAPPLYYIHRAFFDLLTPIAQLGDWADNVTTEIGRILSLGEITLYLEYWLDRAEWSWQWITDAWYHVTDLVDTWWSSTQLTVRAWIDEATTTLQLLINDLSTSFQLLNKAWDDFKGMIPTIDQVIYWWNNWTGNVLTLVDTWWTSTMGEVEGLIDSAFAERESWWAGWSDFRSSVAEFFGDPLEYLWTRFTDWFLGPEV